MLDKKGFTVAETLIVIIVLLVAAAIGVPYVIRASAEQRVATAREVFANGLHRARYLATSQNRPYVLKLDETTKTVSVYPDDDLNFLEDANSPIKTLQFPIDKRVSVEIDFGTYLGAPGNNFLMVEPSGSILSKYQTPPPIGATGSPEPEVSLKAQNLGFESTAYIKIGRFGSLSVAYN
ncbi:MAG: hypothetical protein KA419_07305 [Acidobacteria bacterium]|nr:hypothetical protein [Acidobacteriota bacterium]